MGSVPTASAQEGEEKKPDAQDGQGEDKPKQDAKDGEGKDGDKEAKDKEAKDKDDKEAKDKSKKDNDKKDNDKKDKEEEPLEPLVLTELPGPVLFLKGERVIVRPGKVLENAQVLVRGGRIQNVGTDLVAPEGARVIEGKVICAAFLDPWSTLGVDVQSLRDGSGDASLQPMDAIDLYEPSWRRERALRAGVTLVESHVAINSGFSGTGVMLSTNPDLHDPEQAVVLKRTAMWARLERAGDVISRIEEVDNLVGKLKSGEDYLQSWSSYETKYTEWQKEITELQEKLEKDFKKAQKDREKDKEKADKDGKEFKEKRYKEPKPPRKPRFDADKEALGHVARGEMPLVVMATRAAVLRNLIEATSDFPALRLIIAGGDQAMHVAPLLVARNIPVMVWPADPLADGEAPVETSGTLSLAGDLARAGVSVLIGSGEGGSSDALPLYAALAVGYGMPEDHALAAITTRVAQAFDAQSEVGQVRRGRRAELLVMDGDPLSVGTQVQFVVSGGEVVVEPKE
ncbi:MAG TPA: hypothetical protein P5218_01320 [Planctomycetota bacterium]|nr:hypothetical protein [Planctomycetota bacterium]HRV80039.1 hypothetical protein [Planctomycetota bacterium]